MASFNAPAPGNKIITDLGALNDLLTRLAKLDPSGATDVPAGAVRLHKMSNGDMQLQTLSGGSWVSIGKLDHDVETIDGHSASTGYGTSAANMIPVRNSQGKIPGDITGNAATASALTATLGVSAGGTGATTPDGARQALGLNNASNITSGALNPAYGGTGRTDGKVTDVFIANDFPSCTATGQLGYAAAKDGTTPDTLVLPGVYRVVNCTVSGSVNGKRWPTTGTYFLQVERNGAYIVQIARRADNGWSFIRTSSNTGAAYTAWLPIGGNLGNASIYIAGNGSDLYTGLNASDPVKTAARAVQIASGFSSAGTVTFRFDNAASYASASFNGGAVPAETIRIANWSNTSANAKAAFDALSDVPHFTGWLKLENGVFQIGNVWADGINVINARATANYLKTGGASVYNGQLDMANGLNAAEWSSVTDGFITLRDSWLVIGGEFKKTAAAIHFARFIRAYGTCSIHANGLTAPDSWACAKFYFDGLVGHSGNALPESWPGTTPGVGVYARAGTLSCWKGSYTSAQAILKACGVNAGGGTYNASIVDLLANAADTAGNNLPVRFGSPNGATYVGAGESGANLPAVLDSANISKVNSENLVLSADGAIYFVTAAANDGSSYKRPLTLSGESATVVTPGDGENSTRVASTNWVRRYCEITKKFLTSHQSLAGYAKTGTAQTFSAEVTFTNWIVLKNNGLRIQSDTAVKGTATANGISHYYQFHDKAMKPLAATYLFYFDSKATAAQLRAYLSNKNSDTASISTGVYYFANGAKTFRPSENNTLSLGYEGYKWKDLYCGNATIHTSDERLKERISAVPDEVLDAWSLVKWHTFVFKDAAAEKGDAARVHAGLVAQEIERAFKASGLDASRHAFFCHDSWEAAPEVRDQDGNIAEPAHEAGDEYALRYEEALCIEAAYQRRRADRLEARLAALEERLAKLEEK